MKLVAPILFLSKLAFSEENKYSSTCNDQGQLEIHIPYANAAISDLLNVDAGDCTALRGPGGGDGDKHEYSHDEASQKSILKININDCGLNKILEDEPILRTGEYYMATANVTIGVTEELTSRDLIFYNAVLGAECGAKTEYTVSFDYSQKIDTHEETDCHELSPDGQCIVAVFEEYDFTFKEYDEAYETEITSASHKANEMIHLQIESSNLPDNKVFSVKQCTFVDKVVDENGDESFERYSMFDATTDCKNDYIDLSVGFRDNSVQIEHRLFLLTRGDHDSYSLECDIKVCDKDDDSSDCTSWKNTCEGGANLACDLSNYTPLADDVVLGQNGEIYSGLTQVHSNFVLSSVGSAFLNKFIQTHDTYDYRQYSHSLCLICTSDKHYLTNFQNPSSTWITVLNSDFSAKVCQDVDPVDFRQKICGWWMDASECNSTPMDWNDINTSASSSCDADVASTIGLFVKTSDYDMLESTCGPFVAARTSVTNAQLVSDKSVGVPDN